MSSWPGRRLLNAVFWLFWRLYFVLVTGKTDGKFGKLVGPQCFNILLCRLGRSFQGSAVISDRHQEQFWHFIQETGIQDRNDHRYRPRRSVSATSSSMTFARRARSALR